MMSSGAPTRGRRWIGVVLAVGLATAGCADEPIGEAVFEDDPSRVSDLEVVSEPLSEQPIPVRFTCDGAGEPPPFQWSGVPEGSRALALVLDDPDAPDGRFLHWNVTDIDPALGSVVELETSAPGAEVGPNALGERSYLPPCPPEGEEHEYELTLYALDERRDPAEGSAVDVRAEYTEDALGAATLTFTYGR